MHAHSLHKAKIQLIYKRIQSSKKNSKNFMLDLHSFMQELNTNPTFAPIIDSIQAELTQDFSTHKNLELHVFKEISIFYKKLKKYIKSNEIDDQKIKSFIKEYQIIEKQHVAINQQSITKRYTLLAHILDLFTTSNVPCTQSFVEQHAIVDTDLNYLKLRENSYTHRQHIFSVLADFMKKYKIINPYITQQLENFYNNKLTQQEISEHQYEILINCLISLRNKKHRTFLHSKFISQYAHLNEMGEIIQTNFAPSMQAYILETERMLRIAQSKVWHHWHNLLSFYSSCEQQTTIELKQKLEIDSVLFKKDVHLLWSFIKPMLQEKRQLSNHLNKSHIEQCQVALLNNDIDTFLTIFKSIIASIPYQIKPKDESSFHIILHMVTGGNSEESTHNGRIDMVYQTNTHIYIFELKFKKNPQQAIEQIYHNRYYEKFLGSKKMIILIGLSINAKGVITNQVEPLKKISF